MSIPRIILAVILGAIVAHAWGIVSWMTLTWHMDPIAAFENEEEVAAVLKAAAPEGSTMFMLPHPKNLPVDATEAQKADPWTSGPYAYGVIRAGDKPFSMGANIGKTFASNFVLALIAGILLAAAAGNLNYLGRAGFVTLIGLFTGIAANVPNHIWWEHPLNFILPNIADNVVTWLLAGLVMAGIIKPSAA